MEFSCNGLWWLPEQTDAKVAGTLKFSHQEGAQLSLAGVLGASRGGFEEKALPVIHGLVYDCPLGNELTLKDSSLSAFSTGMPGFARETYLVARVFGGQHLGADEFLFSKAKLRYSGLPGWAHGLTGLSHRQLPEEGQHGTWEIRWVWREPISGQVPGGWLSLGVGASFSMGRRRAAVSEEVGISLAFDEPHSEVSINADYAGPLQNFFTLATDQPNSLEELAVCRPNDPRLIRVVAARVFHEPKDTDYLLPHKMIFSLEDVKGFPIELLGRWLEVYGRLSKVCGMFFAMLYKPSYTDYNYLANFQSLQIYESTRRTGDDEPARLRRLLEEYWEVIGPLFKNDLASVTIELIQLRDYIVHKNSDLGKVPDYSVNLYWSGQRLAFLLKACLLSELGFSIDDVKKFFFRNQSFLYLQSLK